MTWGRKILEPDAMDFRLMTEIDYVVRTGGQIIWDNVELATQEQLDEEQRQRDEYAAQAAAAFDAWVGGECCGHVDRLQSHGFCHLACGGCYRHPQGLELARAEWAAIDTGAPDDLISPWNRSGELQRLLKEMEEFAHGKESNDSNGDPASNDCQIQ